MSFKFDMFDWPEKEELTDEQKRVKESVIILSSKDVFTENAELRFVVGSKERHTRPGKGTYEKNVKKVDFTELNRIYNWRRIMADDFEGDMRYETSFTLDGHEWQTVSHYMLAMLYINSPEFMILFSLDSKERGDGFWGSVEAAMDGHLDNIRRGTFPIDTEYADKSMKYLLSAYLAKFTQNPIAKKVLLLTGNAIIAKRGGSHGITEINAYSQIRDIIRKSPKMVYKGVGLIEQEIEVIPTIDSPLDLNSKILGIPKDLVNIDFETLDVEEQSCIIYAAIGVYQLNVENLVESLGQFNIVERNVFGLEMITYDSNEKIFIALQKNATSIQNKYLTFEADVGVNITIYIEIFENGFGIFILSSVIDNNILTFLKALTKIS